MLADTELSEKARNQHEEDYFLRRIHSKVYLEAIYDLVKPTPPSTE